MSKTITVKTESGDVVVRKLALGDYARLLKSMKKLPAELGKFIDGSDKEQLKDMDKLIGALPSILGDAIPEFCEILAVVSDKPAKFFETELDLADSIDVLAAALEINDYSRVVENVKKITARKTTAPAPNSPAAG